MLEFIIVVIIVIIIIIIIIITILMHGRAYDTSFMFIHAAGWFPQSTRYFYAVSHI